MAGMPETRRGAPAAGRPVLHVFAWVLFATLAVDLVTSQMFVGPPVIPLTTGLGRWVIGLAAGFVGVRHTRGVAASVAAACGGMVLATLLTAAVYVLTGQAAADFYGPGAVLALLIGGTAIALVAPTVGALACLAVARLRARSA